MNWREGEADHIKTLVEGATDRALSGTNGINETQEQMTDATP